MTDKRFKRPNPPTGSTIYYHLNKDIPEQVKIAILDISGTVVRDLEGPKEAGLHQVFWDFRKNPPQQQAGQSRQSMPQRFRRRAPMVGPGEYLVRLTAGDKVLTTRLVIEKDNPGYLGR
jgi:hypothetical protein